MKKIILLFTLLSTNVFAENLLYCPEKIVCTQEGDINSCQTVGGNPEAWEGNRWANGKIQATTYNFQYATGVYQISSKTRGYITECEYFYSSGKVVTNITIENSYDLEAHIEGDNDWMVAGYSASCMVSNPTAKDCPYHLFVGKK